MARKFPRYFFTFKISSAEQSKKEQSRDNVEREGCILPEIYCEIVGFDTPNACAISVFVLPEFSISAFIFLLMISSKVFSIPKLY